MARKKNNKFAEVVVAGTAITGAALGAAAVLLSDKKNQQRIKETITQVTNQATSLGKSIKETVDKYRNSAPKKLVGKSVMKKTAKKIAAKTPAVEKVVVKKTQAKKSSSKKSSK